MANCPKCKKVVEYGDPEINVLDLGVQEDEAIATVEIILKCAECETELKSFVSEDAENIENCFEHEPTCPTLLEPTNRKYKPESWDCDAYEPEVMDEDNYPDDGEIHFGYEMDAIIRCNHCKAESDEDGLIFKNSVAEKYFETLPEE